MGYLGTQFPDVELPSVTEPLHNLCNGVGWGSLVGYLGAQFGDLEFPSVTKPLHNLCNGVWVSCNTVNKVTKVDKVEKSVIVITNKACKWHFGAHIGRGSLGAKKCSNGFQETTFRNRFCRGPGTQQM